MGLILDTNFVITAGIVEMGVRWLRLRLPAHGAATEDKTTSTGETWAEQLEACVAECMSEAAFDVESLAQKIGYSPRQLMRRVVELHGMSPAAFLLARRLARVKEWIEERRFETVAEVASAVGLSLGYFSRRYRQFFSIDHVDRGSPGWRAGDRGHFVAFINTGFELQKI